MDSQELLQKYMRKEIGKPVISEEEKKARQLIDKVTLAKGFTFREKCEAVNVDYSDFMAAQRLIGAKY